jgi:hypothetical protein
MGEMIKANIDVANCWVIALVIRYTGKKWFHTKLKKGFEICNEFETFFNFRMIKVP